MRVPKNWRLITMAFVAFLSTLIGCMVPQYHCKSQAECFSSNAAEDECGDEPITDGYCEELTETVVVCYFSCGDMIVIVTSEDSDGDGDIDITVDVDVTVDNENNNSNSNDNTNTGDDDSDSDDDDTDEPEDEICDDGLDNDGDGLIDSDDPDCADDPEMFDEVGNYSCCVDVDGDSSCDADHGDVFATEFEDSSLNGYSSDLWASYNSLSPICVRWPDGTWDHIDNDGDGYSEDEGDCNDTNSAINPAAQDVCDGYDNNCDGLVDNGVSATDFDGDGYYNPACHASGDDCDDGAATTYPGYPETCDSVDHDCSGYVKDVDLDGDGYAHSDCGSDSSEIGPYLTAGDCHDTTALVGYLSGEYHHPGAPEFADWVDNDCDGDVDETCNWDCSGANDLDGSTGLYCSDDWDWYYFWGSDISYLEECTDESESYEANCEDGYDNDADGLIDGDDEDCVE